MGRIRYRINQGVRHLTGRPDRVVDAALQALLTPAQWALMSRLSPADRIHLLAVHQELVRRGYADPDLLRAALLHDVGKADERGRVNVFHRALKVVLGVISRSLLERFAQRGRGTVGHGLHLALNHPIIGAELARTAGASERTCWFIAHHDDGTIPGDCLLQTLQEIDAKG